MEKVGLWLVSVLYTKDTVIVKSNLMREWVRNTRGILCKCKNFSHGDEGERFGGICLQDMTSFYSSRQHVFTNTSVT